MPTLAYIGGYGRSGSTLLESLMATHPHVLGCGEIANVTSGERRAKRRCSCGAQATECAVWQGVSGDMPHLDLALALLDRSAPGYACVVDSSKTSWGALSAPFKFRRRLGDRFRLIHLVRDPQAVSWSMVRNDRRLKTGVGPLMRCTRTALGWWAANLTCYAFGLAHPHQYLRLHYEDLAREPEAVVQKAMEFALPGDASGLGVADNRHQLYGNRVRQTKPSFSDVKEDQAWKSEMPALYSTLVSLLTLSWR